MRLERPLRLLALVATGAALGFGIHARVAGVREALLFGDEMHSLALVTAGYRAIATTYERNGSGLALPFLQRVAVDLFGLDHWTIRWPALFGSLGTLAAAFVLERRRDGWAAALGATALLAVSPFHVFYGHFARIYALAALASLLLVGACARLVDEAPPRARHWAAVAALGAILPVLHLTTAGLVASLLTAVAALLVARAPLRARLRPLALTAAAAFAGCLLLYAPSRRSTAAFVQAKTAAEYPGSVGVVDVLALIGGSRAAGVVLLALAGVAAVLAVRRRETWPVLLLAAVVGPAAALVAARPYGDTYAYARYLMPSAVALALLAARTAAWAGAALARGRGAPLVALAPALVVVATAGRALVLEGPHASTYLSIAPLPAFDAPWAGRSAFYRTLPSEGSCSLIEAPALMTRSRQLHRNAWLGHRCRTLLGLLPSERPSVLPAGPYVDLASGDPRASGADFLVLHLRAGDEVARYWAFVYAQPDANAQTTRALMERQRTYFGVPDPAPALVHALRARLGTPVWEDADVVAWRLR